VVWSAVGWESWSLFDLVMFLLILLIWSKLTTPFVGVFSTTQEVGVGIKVISPILFTRY
jgi:hypothetical protein